MTFFNSLKMKPKHKEEAPSVFFKLNERHIIAAIILLGFIIRILCLFNYNNSLYLDSDDGGYIFSAINLLKTGRLTYGVAWPSEPTMIIMPGMTLLLAGIFAIVGYTQSALLFVRFIFVILGCFTILGVFKTGKRLFNTVAALISALITAVWLPFVITDNLILTESPFTVCLVWFVFFVLKFCETKSNKDFLLLLLFYFSGLMFRNTIALLPVLFILYFYQKKFPIKLLLKRGVYAVALLVILLTPWWVRNYMVVGTFVPTTGGSGDPLLGGTYAGQDYYPKDGLTNAEAREQFYHADEINSLYMRMEREKDYAMERIQQHWEYNKGTFLKTYLIDKPLMSWNRVYFPIPIFDFSWNLVTNIHLLVMGFVLLGAVFGIFRKRIRSNTLLCIFILLYATVFCAIFLPYPRYIQPFLPFAFLLAGSGIYEIVSGARLLAAKLTEVRKK